MVVEDTTQELAMQPKIIEQQTVEGVTKYAVVFDVPVYEERGLFSKTRIRINSQRQYMGVSKAGFPIFPSLYSYWTEDKNVANNLLKAAASVVVDPIVKDPPYNWSSVG